MISVEQYAYSNKLRGVHPGEKMVFSLGTLLLSLGARSVWTSLATLGLTSWLLVGVAGVPFRFYIRMLLIPLSFLAASVIAIVITISWQAPQGMLYSFSVGDLSVGITGQDLGRAVQLFLRVLPGVSCLYFLTLTTPLIEIMSVFRRLRVPSLFLELMGLIYRFSFVLLDTAENIYLSQSSRLGYSSWFRSLSSLGQLAANLFLKSFQRSQMLDFALVSRGFSGEFRVLEPTYTVSKRNILLIFLWIVFLVVLNWYGGGGRLGTYFGN